MTECFQTVSDNTNFTSTRVHDRLADALVQGDTPVMYSRQKDGGLIATMLAKCT